MVLSNNRIKLTSLLIFTVIVSLILYNKMIQLYEDVKLDVKVEHSPPRISSQLVNAVNTTDQTARSFIRTLQVLIASSANDDDGVVVTFTDRKVDPHELSSSERKSHIVIGLGIASVSYRDRTPDNLLFFTKFLTSFCNTASADLHYHLYLAYDYNDVLFNSHDFRSAFVEFYRRIKIKSCPEKSITLTFLQCPHKKRPAWAQNDAMIEAYLDGFDYFYRINDDTILTTSNWGHTFIRELSLFKPPNVGVVGPKHKGGNVIILTYDFVHRTHIDIFGFYYPRIFSDWYADTWISKVYEPGNFKKLSSVNVLHLLSKRRYLPDYSLAKEEIPRISIDKSTLKRYISFVQKSNSTPDLTTPTDKIIDKIICISLDSNSPTLIMGTLRNAFLTPIMFPGWKLRVYATFDENSAQVNNGSLAFNKVPFRVVHCLRRLGAEVINVDETVTKYPSYLWNYLVLDDLNADYFIVRKSYFRLSGRDFMFVNDFVVKSQERLQLYNIRSTTYETAGLPDQSHPLLAFHDVKDSTWHSNSTIIPGLIGGYVKAIRQLINSQSIFQNILDKYSEIKAGKDEVKEEKLLEEYFLNDYKSNFYRHDGTLSGKNKSVSCDNCAHKEAKDCQNRLGLKFNRYHIPDDESWLMEINEVKSYFEYLSI